MPAIDGIDEIRGLAGIGPAFGGRGYSRAGVIAGAKGVQGVDDGGIAPLLAMDWRQPPIQPRPLSIAGVPFDAVWYKEPGSGNIVDEVVGHALVPANSPLRSRELVGLYSGDHANPWKGLEFDDASTAVFQSADSSFLQVNAATSIIIVQMMRMTRTPSSNLTTCGKHSGQGYRLEVRSTRQIRAAFTDDEANTDIPASHVGVPAPGEWFIAAAVFDRAAGLCWCYGNVHEDTVATTITANDLSNSVGFGIGAAAGNSGPVQVAFTAIALGSKIEGFTRDDLLEMWHHGEIPGVGGLCPKLKTYSRNGVAGTRFGVSSLGERVAYYGVNQAAFAYNPNFTHASKMGLYIPDARTNLVARSEELDDAAWVNKVGVVAVTADDDTDPSGVKAAEKLTAANNPDQTKGRNYTTAASTEYTQSGFVRRAIGTDVTGRLVMYDETGAAEVAGQAYTALATLTRHSLTATTNVGEVTTSWRVEIDSNNEAIHCWGAMAHGGKVTGYIPTYSSTATRPATSCDLDNPGGNTRLKSVRGEIEVVVACDAALEGSERWLCDNNDGTAGGNADRIALRINPNGSVTALIYDSAGTLKQVFSSSVIADWTTEHVIRLRWDSENGVDGNSENADMIIDGTRYAGAATTWTASNACTLFRFGRARNDATHLNGAMATFFVYPEPRPEVL